MGGTAEFGWGPEDPVDEGQLELRGVVFTESSGGSPLFTTMLLVTSLQLARLHINGSCLKLNRVSNQ